jgi:hypothetical protein
LALILRLSVFFKTLLWTYSFLPPSYISLIITTCVSEMKQRDVVTSMDLAIILLNAKPLFFNILLNDLDNLLKLSAHHVIFSRTRIRGSYLWWHSKDQVIFTEFRFVLTILPKFDKYYHDYYLQLLSYTLYFSTSEFFLLFHFYFDKTLVVSIYHMLMKASQISQNTGHIYMIFELLLSFSMSLVLAKEQVSHSMQIYVFVVFWYSF